MCVFADNIRATFTLCKVVGQQRRIEEIYCRHLQEDGIKSR